MASSMPCSCLSERREAIATAQGECNTLAVYAFELQRICRIFVQNDEIVANEQLLG
jgi:hypothetical protein